MSERDDNPLTSSLCSPLISLLPALLLTCDHQPDADLCHTVQIIMLYCVEKASRLTFVKEMQSAKLVADIQQAASNADASAERLVNDAVCVTVLLILQKRQHHSLSR